MEVTAVILSGFALLVSIAAVLVQWALARQANSVPVLIDLFREHRGAELAEARRYVVADLKGVDLSRGLASLPEQRRTSVRELMWFYDNLGVLVVHGVVDIRPVSGYLGGAATEIWRRLEPLIQAERNQRASMDYTDARRWQEYFEMLIERLEKTPPDSVRSSVNRRRVLGLFG